ncbi:hypothetical protein QJR26_06990 [Clostridium baratii]
MEAILITIVAATIGSAIGYYLFIKYNEEELKNETTEKTNKNTEEIFS